MTVARLGQTGLRRRAAARAQLSRRRGDEGGNGFMVSGVPKAVTWPARTQLSRRREDEGGSGFMESGVPEAVTWPARTRLSPLAAVSRMKGE